MNCRHVAIDFDVNFIGTFIPILAGWYDTTLIGNIFFLKLHKKTKKTKRQKDKRQRPKREINIVTSGQFRTLAMFIAVRIPGIDL